MPQNAVFHTQLFPVAWTSCFQGSGWFGAWDLVTHLHPPSFRALCLAPNASWDL